MYSINNLVCKVTVFLFFLVSWFAAIGFSSEGKLLMDTASKSGATSAFSSETREESSENSKKWKKEIIEKFSNMEWIMKGRIASFVVLSREGVNTYIPLLLDGELEDGRVTNAVFTQLWDRSVHYQGIYVYHYPLQMANEYVVIQRDRVRLLREFINGEGILRKFYSFKERDNYVRKKINFYFTHSFSKKKDILQAIKKISSLEPLYYEGFSDYDTYEKKLSLKLCTRLNGILIAFSKAGERKSTPLSNMSTRIVNREDELFAACNPALMKKGYRFYGSGDKIFGMSLPGADMLATEHSWPVYLEQLFDALRVYCRTSGEEAQKALKAVISLCDEIETRVKENSMDRNPFFAEDWAGGGKSVSPK